MSCERFVLLAGTALIVVAMSAPGARAELPEWYHGETKVGGAGNAKVLHLTGELANSVIGAGGLVSGPCSFTFEGVAWNENEMADGVITGGVVQHICETNAADCSITPTLQNFPWDLTGETPTETKGLEIVGAQLEIHYINEVPNACPVPVTTIMTTGALTGLVEEEDHRCLSFETHVDSMLTHAPLPTLAVDFTGRLCETTLTLT